MDVSGNVVSTDYFRTLGVAVLEGREFTGEDHADSPPVAIVNRTLAERLWPGRSAVGRVLTFPRSGGDRTVVGVVDVVRYNTLAEPARPLAYLPLAQRFFPRAFIHTRSPADAGVTLQHVRRVLADLDPAVPLSGESTLGDRVEEALDRWRAPAMLAGILAVVTLVLTMGGLYGVLMLAVGQRTRELAIRVALGAREASVRWIVLCPGVAAGCRRGAGRSGCRGSADGATRKPVVRDRPARRHDAGRQPGRAAGGGRRRLRPAGAAGGSSRHRRRAAQRMSWDRVSTPGVGRSHAAACAAPPGA